MNTRNSKNISSGTLPAGIYYVGDLCYVVDDGEWKKYCSRSFPFDDYNEVVGIFQASSGASYAQFGTMYGDGTYLDNYGNKYPVDSGSIGCVPISEIWTALDNPETIKLGNIVTFTEPLKVSYNSETGVISIGNIDIMTGVEEEEDEEEDYDE